MSQCQFVVEPESILAIFEVLPGVTPVVPLDVNNDVHLFLSHPKQAIRASLIFVRSVSGQSQVLSVPA